MKGQLTSGVAPCVPMQLDCSAQQLNSWMADFSSRWGRGVTAIAYTGRRQTLGHRWVGFQGELWFNVGAFAAVVLCRVVDAL